MTISLGIRMYDIRIPKLGGRLTKLKAHPPPSVSLEIPRFSLDQLPNKILSRVLSITGSYLVSHTAQGAKGPRRAVLRTGADSNSPRSGQQNSSFWMAGSNIRCLTEGGYSSSVRKPYKELCREFCLIMSLSRPSDQGATGHSTNSRYSSCGG